MGVLVNPHVLLTNPGLLLLLVGVIVLGKFVIWVPIVRLFGYSWKTAVAVGVGLGQIGEFSYVLVQVARDAKLVGDDMYNATLAASVITILLNGVFMRFLPAKKV